MTIRACRITKSRHAAAAFSGYAARMFGGRWNNPGTAVVYSAGTESLAILEMLVHLQARELMHRYVIFDLEFDSSLVIKVETSALPKSWRKAPPPAALRRLGDEWVSSGRSAVLQLPSAIVPNEWNFLINPAHSDFQKIAIGPKRTIAFDVRLIKTAEP